MAIWNRLNTFCFIRYAYFLTWCAHVNTNIKVLCIIEHIEVLVTVLPRPEDTGEFDSSSPQIFLCTPKFCCSQKNLLWTYDKNKIFFPYKCILLPQTLKPGYGPGSAKIVSAIRIFCFEGHSASRCSITSKLRGPLCAFFGGQIWAAAGLLTLSH